MALSLEPTTALEDVGSNVMSTAAAISIANLTDALLGASVAEQAESNVANYTSSLFGAGSSQDKALDFARRLK